VKDLIQKPGNTEKTCKKLYISLGLTGGMALLFAVTKTLLLFLYSDRKRRH
jgi:hypothetical protein